MRVHVEEGHEADVARVCPKGVGGLFACKHCDPESAPCMASENAYECVKGVICFEGTDPSEASLCPYDALKWNGNSLVKCDLCAPDFGYPLCYLKLREHVRIELTDEELDLIGREVGWFAYGDADFVIPFDPILPWEARLVAEAVSLLEKTRGEYTLEEVVEDISEEREVPPYTRERVLEIARITLSPLGPLSLIKGDDIEEVTVVGLKRPVKIFVRGKGWLDTNLFIWTEEYFSYLVNKAAEGLGRRLTLKDMRVNAVMRDGSRLHAAIPPLSNVHTLTVRRHAVEPLTPSHLIDSGLLSPRHMAILWAAMDMELNVLVAGNTGSGKTTLLNALFGFVPLDERIIAVEEVPEVRLPHPHFIRLTPMAGVDMEDLIKDTLRMRPDRIIVGEIRSDREARAYMETVLAGQGRGSYATVHGRSVKEVGQRLLSMGIDEVDLESIDLVTVLRRRGSGGKIIRELVEMGNFRGEVPAIDERELRARETFLRQNKVYRLEEFVRRYSKWTFRE